MKTFKQYRKEIHSEGFIKSLLSKTARATVGAINKAHELNKKTPLPQKSDRREFQKPKFEEVMVEDGMGGAVAAAPTNSVAGVAGSGDSRLPSSQREPGVSKKRNPILKGMARRNPPKM